MPARPDAILPDLLAPGLRLVFCGTAAGARSAAEGAYYAHPGNLFWRALFDAGLTPHVFAPAEFRQLLPLGIGLTDLAKRHSGNDAELPRDALDADTLRRKVQRCRPCLLAFTSKNAARAALGRAVDYGVQEETFGATRLFVLPSPSGQARGHWSLQPWLALGALYRAEHAR
ncbi:MAG: mismatch-specific DNA-glycosylase [Rhodanobacter sp.]